MVGCSHVTLHDEVWHVIKGPLGALEVHTQTDTTKDLTKAQWDAISFGELCTSINNFGDDKADLEKLCSENPVGCDVDTQEQMQALFTKIAKIRKHLKDTQDYLIMHGQFYGTDALFSPAGSTDVQIYGESSAQMSEPTIEASPPTFSW